MLCLKVVLAHCMLELNISDMRLFLSGTIISVEDICAVSSVAILLFC